MPYKKVGTDNYVSPNGTHINKAQNTLWHTLGGRWPGQAKEPSMSKFNSKPQNASYAEGGAVLGRTRDFLKTPDEFREADGDNGADEDDKYGKEGDGKGSGFIKPPKAAGKSLKAIKPRK